MGRVFTVKPTPYEIQHAHAFLAGESYAATHDGSLPVNRYWRDLEFRYARNPDAFAINHRNFKLLFDRLGLDLDKNHVYDHHRPDHWLGRMRGPREPLIPSCPVDPPQLTPQIVPEPDSLPMGLTCIAAWFVAAVMLARRDSRK